VGIYLGVGEGRQDFSYSVDIPKQESTESARIVGWNKKIEHLQDDPCQHMKYLWKFENFNF